MKCNSIRIVFTNVTTNKIAVLFEESTLNTSKSYFNTHCYTLRIHFVYNKFGRLSEKHYHLYLIVHTVIANVRFNFITFNSF